MGIIDEYFLEKRLASIESRLSRIEANLGLPSQQQPEVGQHAAPPPPVPVSVSFTIPEEAPYVEQEQPQEPQASDPEMAFSAWYFLGFLSVVCFIAAAAFIIKLAVDSGWLTHERQTGLAALLGLSLVLARFIAPLLRTINSFTADEDYINFLPTAGIVILYLTALAAHGYYALISCSTALGLIGAVSAICIGLYLHLDYKLFAVIAVLGSYLSPLALYPYNNTEVTLGYFILCALAFVLIGIEKQSRYLIILSAYGAALIPGIKTASHMFWPDALIAEQKAALIAAVLLLQLGIHSLGMFFYNRRNQTSLNGNEAMALFGAMIIFYSQEYIHLTKLTNGLAPTISLLFTAAFIALYLTLKKQIKDTINSDTLVYAFSTVVFVHSFYFNILSGDQRPWLFVALCLVFALSQRYGTSKEIPTTLQVPLFGALFIVILEYVSMLRHLIVVFDQPHFGGTALWLTMSCAALASLWAVVITTQNKLERLFPLVLAHVLALLALYRLTIDFGSLAHSASWLFYAITVMFTAYYKKDDFMAKSALLVLIIATSKALLHDASSAPTVVRILCLLLTGVVLYCSGLFMRSIESWHKSKE